MCLNSATVAAGFRLRGPGAYGVPPAQGCVLVTVTSCPRHLSTPAAHSLIVCSTPSTSTQTLKPPSSHSDASLQTHLPLWAANTNNDRGSVARGGGGRAKAHDLLKHDAFQRALEAPASGIATTNPPSPPQESSRTQKARHVAPLRISRV